MSKTTTSKFEIYHKQRYCCDAVFIITDHKPDTSIGSIRAKLTWGKGCSLIALSHTWDVTEDHNDIGNNHLNLLIIPEPLRRKKIATFIIKMLYDHIAPDYRNNLLFSGSLASGDPIEPKQGFWKNTLIFDKSEHHYFTRETVENTGSFKGYVNPKKLKHPHLTTKPL